MSAFAVGTGSGTVAPDDIANLLAWYDASDTGTITDAGGGAVSAWADKSGNGYTLTESTNRPVTGTRTINSLNVIDFDGTNDKLSSSCPADDRSITDFCVGLVDNVSGSARTLWASSVDGGAAARLNVTTGVWQLEKSGLLALATLGFGPSLSTPFVFAVNLTSSAYLADQDDDISLLARGTDSNTFTAATTLQLGAAAGARPWDGVIGEFVRYSRSLDPSEFGGLLAYFVDKWAI